MWTREHLMLNWMKRRGSALQHRHDAHGDTVRPSGRVMTGQYLLLYQYLEHRFADSVVLTFGEIEDLLGFTLPEQARQHQEWWTDAGTRPAGSHYTDSWILASRTAVPNMRAQTVIFDRVA
jgi:hypothetical protein